MYATTDEIRSSIKDDMVEGLLGEYIEDEAVREAALLPFITEAIEDACAEIDGYLNSKYSTPLSTVPKIINKCTKDIAVYNLITSRMGLDEGDRENIIQTKYKQAIRYFENVAKGLLDIGIKKPSQTASAEYSINSSPRLFSRKSMNGM